jgi:hypothetical protein
MVPDSVSKLATNQSSEQLKKNHWLLTFPLTSYVGIGILISSPQKELN